MSILPIRGFLDLPKTTRESMAEGKEQAPADMRPQACRFSRQDAKDAK